MEEYEEHLQMLETAIRYSEDVLQPKLIDNVRYYKRWEKENQNEETKYTEALNIVSPDVANTVNSIMPTTMEIFLNSSAISISSQDPDEKKMVQDGVQRHILREKSYPLTMYRALMSAFVTGFGVVKVIHEETFRTIRYDIDEDEVEGFQDQKFEIIEKEGEDGEISNRIAFKKIPKYSGPKFYYVDAGDFFYLPDGDTIYDSSLMAHRTIVNEDFINQKVKGGHYDLVKPKEDGTPDINWGKAEVDTSSTWKQAETRNTDGYTSNDNKPKGMKKYEVFECYTKMMDNDIDELIDVIMTVVGGSVVRIDGNPYGIPPLGVFMPQIDFVTNTPDSMTNWIKDHQIIKTNILRQYIKNIIKLNNPRPRVDPVDISNGGVIWSDLLSKDYTRPVRARKDAVDMDTFAVKPLPSDALRLFEVLTQQEENITSVTRYNQGTDSASLNQTATGISTILQQSMKRIRLTMRMLVETGFSPLLEVLTEMFKEMGIIKWEESYLYSENGLGYKDNMASLQKMLASEALITRGIELGVVEPTQYLEFIRTVLEMQDLPVNQILGERNEQQGIEQAGPSGIPGQGIPPTEENADLPQEQLLE